MIPNLRPNDPIEPNPRFFPPPQPFRFRFNHPNFPRGKISSIILKNKKHFVWLNKGSEFDRNREQTDRNIQNDFPLLGTRNSSSFQFHGPARQTGFRARENRFSIPGMPTGRLNPADDIIMRGRFFKIS